MIENGWIIISIPIEKQSEFYELLIKYYETNDKEKLVKFIYRYVIDGMILQVKIDFLNKINPFYS